MNKLISDCGQKFICFSPPPPLLTPSTTRVFVKHSEPRSEVNNRRSTAAASICSSRLTYLHKLCKFPLLGLFYGHYLLPIIVAITLKLLLHFNTNYFELFPPLPSLQ